MNILLFDYDGVIADSLEAYVQKVIKVSTKYNLKGVTTQEDFLKLFEDNFYTALINKGLSQERIPALQEEFRLTNKESADIKVVAGIKAVLRKLSQHNKLFIITSNLTKTIEQAVQQEEIEYFQQILGGDKEVSKVKKIQNIRKMFPNNNLYYIGDTTGDIKEGKNAGVRTVAVTWGWHTAEQLKAQHPDFIIHTPSELLKLFS